MGGQNYQIIGRYAGVFSVIIPAPDFARVVDRPDFITLRFAENDNNLQVQAEILAYIQIYFPQAFVQPPFYIGLDPLETNIIAGLLAILYGLALSSISFISQYMFERNRSADLVYRLLGCSKKQLKQIGLVENVFLGLCSLTISFSLHRLLYLPLFKQLNLSPEVSYSGLDYLRIGLIILAITVMLYLFRQGEQTKKGRVIS